MATDAVIGSSHIIEIDLLQDLTVSWLLVASLQILNHFHSNLLSTTPDPYGLECTESFGSETAVRLSEHSPSMCDQTDIRRRENVASFGSFGVCHEMGLC